MGDVTRMPKCDFFRLIVRTNISCCFDVPHKFGLNYIISGVTRLGDLLPKSSTFLSNFCKVVKIYHFSIEIVFGPLL